MRSVASLIATALVAAAPAQAEETPSCSPDTFEQALDCVSVIIGEDGKQQFETMAYKDLSLTHFGLGLWIRNNWIHGDRTGLAKSMSDMGFRHPDDMSGTIIAAYWARTRGCDFDFDAVLAYYDAYWTRIEAVRGDRDPETGAIPTRRPEGASPKPLTRPTPDCPFDLNEPGSNLTLKEDK